MDFLIDNEFEPEIINKIEVTSITDKCICGQTMRTLKENGVKKYICDDCGRYINTHETFENCVEVGLLENIKPEYGNKSGDVYIKKIKEDLMNDINKITRVYPITEPQLLGIVNKFLAIRAERIPRAKPRIGLICACVYNETKIPVEKLSEVFKIKLKHVTEGIKTIFREISPFAKVSVTDIIEEMFVCIKLNKPDLLDKITPFKNIIIEIISMCIGYYIGYNTTIRTKCGGVLCYLIATKKLNVNLKHVMEGLKLSKSTIDKFYENFLVYLHATGRPDGLYGENFKFRREQLRNYLIFRKIDILPLPPKIQKKYNYIY